MAKNAIESIRAFMREVCQGVHTPAASLAELAEDGFDRLLAAYLSRNAFRVGYIPLTQSGALICIRADDQNSNWLVPDPLFAIGGVNKSVSEYAWWRGVPITHCVIGGQTSGLTDSQLCDCVLLHGAELACHSWNHLGGPTNYQEMVDELIKTKSYLEGSSIANYYNGVRVEAGMVVRGFAQPGTWGTGSDLGNIDARIDNYADLDKWTARFRRENFEWTSDDAIGYSALGMYQAMARYHTKYSSIASMPWASAAACKTWLTQNAVPGASLEFLIHNPYAEAKDKLKFLIDAIADIRDDFDADNHRGAFPKTLAHAVTGTALRLGIQRPPRYAPQAPITVSNPPTQAEVQAIVAAMRGGGEIVVDSGLGAIDWESQAAGPVSGYVGPFYFPASSSIVDSGDPIIGKHARLDATAAPRTFLYIFSLIPGRHYAFRFLGRNNQGSAFNFILKLYYFYDAADDDQTIEAVVSPHYYTAWRWDHADTAWHWATIPFYVPRWCDGHAYISLETPAASGRIFDIDRLWVEMI